MHCLILSIILSFRAIVILGMIIHWWKSDKVHLLTYGHKQDCGIGGWHVAWVRVIAKVRGCNLINWPNLYASPMQNQCKKFHAIVPLLGFRTNFLRGVLRVHIALVETILL